MIEAWSPRAARTDPAVDVPEPLFADPAAEARWRGRFTAARISVPDWARDAPAHSVYSSNASGTWEVYAWDRSSDTHRQVTDRPQGTRGATVSRRRHRDLVVRRHRRRRVRRLGPRALRPATRRPSRPSPAPSAATRRGSTWGARRWRSAGRPTTGRRSPSRSAARPLRTVYTHTEDAGIGALSRDETLLAISHSEHGDSRHPAVRVLRVADGVRGGRPVRRRGQGPGPVEFAPVEGDTRLLVGHERRGRDELLIWDPATGTETELDIDLPGDLVRRLLPRRLRAARRPHPRGAHDPAPLRPRDRRAVRPADGHRLGRRRGRAPRRDGRVRLVVGGVPVVGAGAAPGRHRRGAARPRPGTARSRRCASRTRGSPGPGGDVHALYARPEGTTGPVPTLFMIHGGPQAADEDR